MASGQMAGQNLIAITLYLSLANAFIALIAISSLPRSWSLHTLISGGGLFK